MAIRKIREMGDDVLTKVCKEVEKVTPRTKVLIDDMFDTMYDAMGVGLAAPQVGVLKRIVTIDVGEGPILLINPEIIETSGEQTGEEGCLSVPGKSGVVTRPNYVKVRAFDEDMKEIVLEGEGLLARAFCHEIDHLDGRTGRYVLRRRLGGNVMRVIFMGTPEFSVGTLETLVEAGHEVVLAVTQPDKPKGRGKEMQFTPVKEAAIRHQIPVYQPVKVREKACVEVLKSYEADVIVVIAFGQILPKSILELTPYGCINVHASLLPKYRGAAPIQWSVIDGEKVSGVTTMQMDEGLDTGDMILKKEVILDEKETGGSLHDKLAEAGAALCVETLKRLEEGTAPAEKQGETTTDYAKMLTKQMGEIDWKQPAEKIERLIRGLNPWPSAYTYWNQKVMKIWLADTEADERGEKEKMASEEAKHPEPGTITAVAKDRFSVQTGEGLLTVLELQIQGKKRMDAGAFLRGYQIKAGEILG